MKLVIVESPTKAKTLSKFLSKEYDVKASMGHINDLPKSGLGVDVDHDFKPEYVVPDKAKKNLNQLKKACEGVSEIVLATDPDREGEAIAWHLKELLGPKKKSKDLTFSRVVFHELTKEAIDEAFKNFGNIDMNLVDAQQARRILDRLVGYKLSPLLWKKVQYGLSAGRVQSVAVRLIVEKERERKNFKAEEYWSINVGLEAKDKPKRNITAELVKKDEKDINIKSLQEAEIIRNELKLDSFFISDIKKSQRERNPYPPYKTSTLQQACFNTFGLPARKTMDAAQKLFEKGYITYHRTDSFNLSPVFIQHVRDLILKEYGKNYLPEKANFYKTSGKNAQEAHEAIRPTDVNKDPNSLRLTTDEKRVYSLVWKRSIECQMMPGIYNQTSISVGSKKGYTLKASGSVILFSGWLAVGEKLGLNGEGDELKVLAEFKVNEVMSLLKILPEQHFTQPPARYSDATLIKKLEELEIGRPSTYAPIINTIQQRKYIVREGRYFVPTDVAYIVIDLLTKYFGNIVDYGFTAKMENDLDDIADGKIKWVPVIKDFYLPFEKNVKEKEEDLKKADFTTLEMTDEKCPECDKNLVVKLGRFGKFLSCSGYPECKYAKPLEEDKAFDENGEEIKDFGKCTECSDGVFILKKGRFGKFLACSNYPKCKTTKPFLEKIGVKCPKCSNGEVVVKKAKGRIFYGCSKYPDCDYSSWKKPE